MFLAVILRKPLFVRHGGNWFVQKTIAESFWKWFMERSGGGRNVMLATGGAAEPPSQHNPNVRWIFSTTLTEQELAACSSHRIRADVGRARLITVCRQEIGKGTEIVIESLPLIMRSFPEATLDVLGDGSAIEQFKRLAASRGLNGRVKFHGRLEHSAVINLLKQSDLFCYPTASEGFPKAVLEALACGLPVITTPVSVLPMLIESGGGMLIKERSAAEVARVVTDCLSNTELYCAMSVQALETAKSFTLERWKETIGEYLQASWGKLRADA
jgi:glycosyltransferase involved in cell wall biosynthesis